MGASSIIERPPRNQVRRNIGRVTAGIRRVGLEVVLLEIGKPIVVRVAAGHWCVRETETVGHLPPIGNPIV